MAKRMRTVLKEYQAGPDYNPRTWAWIKNCWKPVKNHRFIKRGKKIGWVKVELFYPENKTVIIPATSVRFADTTNASGKLQKSQKVGK